MRNFKILDHIADIRLYVQASNLEEFFRAALEGMSFILKSNSSNKINSEQLIKLNSSDTTTLLINFLSEVLTLSQINKVIYKKVDFVNINSTSLEAKIFGCFVKNFDEDIKAVTYHEAEVKKNNQGILESTIIFDI